MINTQVLGRLGAYSLLIHVIILLVGTFFSVTCGFLFIGIIGENLPVLSTDYSLSEQILNNENKSGSLIVELIQLMNSIQKILGRLVLLLIFLTVVFAAFTAKFFIRFAKKINRLAEPLSVKSMKWLRVFLLSMPVAVFSLVLPMSSKSGFTAVGVAGLFVVVLSGLLILFLALIYLAVYFFGSEKIGKFSSGVFSSQIVAVSTRSSLATMPSLMRDAETKLHIPKTISAVIIPFFVSVFRLNRVISSPFKFIFLTYVYQLPLDISTFLFFLLVQGVVSFGSPGIPSGGKYLNLPIYLAAGIPMDGYILLKAVDAVPDIFKTLLNVTEVMAVTTIVAKKAKWKFGHNLI
jgi:Na+/H+-dicarboxylate symporter